MTRDPAPKAAGGRFTPRRNDHRHPADLIGIARRWDPYPFILLNLLFSTQAAYAAPLILLSQNHQSDTDRIKAEHDYRVNQLALGYLVAWHHDRHGNDCGCVREALDGEALINLRPGVPSNRRPRPPEITAVRVFPAIL